MKILLGISCSDDNGEVPHTAIVETTERLYKRVIELQQATISVKAAEISDYECPDMWVANNPIEDDEEPVEWNMYGLDLEKIVVDSTDVGWEAFLETSSTFFETGQISIEHLKTIRTLKLMNEDILVPLHELDEVLKIYNTPLKELPLLIGDLKSECATTVLEKRLKNG